jgi:hypothetical protein
VCSGHDFPRTPVLASRAAPVGRTVARTICQASVYEGVPVPSNPAATCWLAVLVAAGGVHEVMVPTVWSERRPASAQRENL